MIKSQNAFSPDSIANNVAGAAMASVIPGMGGMPGGGGPSFQSSSSASGKSGDNVAPFTYDNSGFSVNYGNGVSQGAAKTVLPSGVWLVAAMAVGVVVWKRYA